MQNQKAINSGRIYKYLFWMLGSAVLIYYLLVHVLSGMADADDLVLKQKLNGGAWMYITHYGAPATDLDTLRFYLTDLIMGSDEEILQVLNDRNSFLITDSALEDVVVRDTLNGVGIRVKGVVYRYFSKQYTKADGLRSYRVSLDQKDERE
jgi:hypothetical protein